MQQAPRKTRGTANLAEILRRSTDRGEVWAKLFEIIHDRLHRKLVLGQKVYKVRRKLGGGWWCQVAVVESYRFEYPTVRMTLVYSPGEKPPAWVRGRGRRGYESYGEAVVAETPYQEDESPFAEEPGEEGSEGELSADALEQMLLEDGHPARED